MAASRKNKKLWIVVGTLGAVVVLIVGIAVVRIAKGDPIDPNRLAKVTRGDVAKSVVATGDIQPITKVDARSIFGFPESSALRMKAATRSGTWAREAERVVGPRGRDLRPGLETGRQHSPRVDGRPQICFRSFATATRRGSSYRP